MFIDIVIHPLYSRTCCTLRPCPFDCTTVLHYPGLTFVPTDVLGNNPTIRMLKRKSCLTTAVYLRGGSTRKARSKHGRKY